MFITSLVLVFFFAFASSIKIAGWQRFIFETQLSFFKKYGLSRSHMLLVGLIEISATSLLIYSLIFENNIANTLGALIIAFTSLGAIFFHLRFDTFKDAFPAITTLILSSYLVAINPVLITVI